MINNLGTPSSDVQINFGVLQIDTENSATGIFSNFFYKNINAEVLPVETRKVGGVCFSYENVCKACNSFKI